MMEFYLSTCESIKKEEKKRIVRTFFKKMGDKKRNCQKEEGLFYNYKKPVLLNEPVTFKPNPKNVQFLNSINEVEINRNKLLNDALELWQDFTNNPKRLLQILKFRYPREWKYISRRRFFSSL